MAQRANRREPGTNKSAFSLAISLVEQRHERKSQLIDATAKVEIAKIEARAASDASRAEREVEEGKRNRRATIAAAVVRGVCGLLAASLTVFAGVRYSASDPAEVATTPEPTATSPELPAPTTLPDPPVEQLTERPPQSPPGESSFDDEDIEHVVKAGEALEPVIEFRYSYERGSAGALAACGISARDQRNITAFIDPDPYGDRPLHLQVDEVLFLPSYEKIENFIESAVNEHQTDESDSVIRALGVHGLLCRDNL